MNFFASVQPHFFCRSCGVLWLLEMEALLRCTDARHVSDAKRFSVAA